MAFALYTQDSFYSADDIARAASDWPAGEVEQVFGVYRRAVDSGDHDTMAGMLSAGGRGGNATFGLFDSRDSYRQFLKNSWFEIIPNHSVWTAVDRGRVVNKWCEVLPGTAKDGKRYDYFGINEVIYNGDGQFRLMYSTPDLFGLREVYKKWRADGQHKEYGDIYPGLVD